MTCTHRFPYSRGSSFKSREKPHAFPFRTTAGEKSTAEERTCVRWPLPRATLEGALNIPYAIKEHNGRELTVAPRDYGLTLGASTAKKIAQILFSSSAS
jgi:hypothetical protein